MGGPINPYAAPTETSGDATPQDLAHGGRCPRCRSDRVEKPGFTWWGGVLGPKLFDHRVCRGCGYGFNGTTGASNLGKIIAYQVLVFVIVGAVIALYWSS
jgi:transposase-like protein